MVCSGSMLPAFIAGVDWLAVRILLVIAVLFLVIFSLRGYLWDRWKRFRTRNWTEATATVTTVQCNQRSGPRGGHFIHVTVNYAYTAGAQQTGSYAVNKNSQGDAAPVAKSLPGRTFTIRYNPQKVGESVSLLSGRPGQISEHG